MPELVVIVISLAAALALASLGGGLYEFRVVDPFWPRRPDLVQPSRGGISRKRFWIPAHIAFELTLIVSLIVAWSAPEVRFWLLVALASHGAMRIWSAFDFIPKALAFEQTMPESFDQDAAHRWTRRSLMRLPFDLVVSGAMLAAVVAVARL